MPKPSDVHLSKLLDTAAEATIASPLSGVILCPLPEPDAEEELEDRDGRVRASKKRPGLGLGAGKKMRKKVGSGRTKSHSSEGTGTMGEIDAAIAKARDARSVGSYKEEMQHGRGAVTSVCAGVRVGVGLGLYHKFAQGVMFRRFSQFFVDISCNSLRPFRSLVGFITEEAFCDFHVFQATNDCTRGGVNRTLKYVFGMFIARGHQGWRIWMSSTGGAIASCWPLNRHRKIWWGYSFQDVAYLA